MRMLRVYWILGYLTGNKDKVIFKKAHETILIINSEYAHEAKVEKQ